MPTPEDASESVEELYENAPCGYVSTRLDGTLVRVNRTLLEWTGYAREELVDVKRLQDLLTVGGRVFFETHMAPLLRMQRSVSEIQLELTCRNGRVLPVLLNTVVRPDATGQPALLRSTVVDITDRKRFERELLLARRRAEQSARSASLAAEIGRALTRPFGIAAQLALCADALIEHQEAAGVRIWSAGPGVGQLSLGAAAGVLVPDGGMRAPPSRESRPARDRVPVRIQGGESLEPEAGEEWIRREGIAAYVGIPLVAGARLLGVLAVYLRAPLDADTEQALSATASELAVGMDRAAAERERDELLLRTEAQRGALEESRELLETTLRSIADAVIATDAQARVTFMNPVAEALTGWSAEQAEGRPLREVFHIVNEATRREVPSPITEALRVGEPAGLAKGTVLIRRDGAEFGIDDSAAPIRGPEGEVMGGVLVFRDVTAQHRAERDLRHAQQRLTTVVQNAPVILFSLDSSGKILVSEGKGLTALGLEERSRTGHSVFDVYGQVPWLLEEIRRALRGEAFVGGGLLRGVTLETHYAPTLDEHGNPSGTVGLVLDVSDRARHEEAVRRTLEFEQQLIDIVSHDLRNPISAILLGAWMLLRKGESLDVETLRTVSKIHASAERSQRLIKDLLDFAQARLGGGIPIHPRDVDLAALVRQVADEVEIGHADRTVTLSLQGDLRGEWDADRLAQVVSNLTVNALKYSPPGSPVEVRLRGEGDKVALEVHNEGPPIPPETMGRIFHPMVRATAEYDKAGRSVGLGLFIVRRIVEAHGGEIEVTSEAEHGTLFRVLLPRAARALPKLSFESRAR
jgi:PAS domain S-box-containing protein